MLLTNFSNDFEIGRRKRPMDLCSEDGQSGTETTSKMCREDQSHRTAKSMIVDLTEADDNCVACTVVSCSTATTSESEAPTSRENERTEVPAEQEGVGAEEPAVEVHSPPCTHADGFVESSETHNSQVQASTTPTTSTSTTSATTTGTSLPALSYQVYLTSTEYAHRHSDRKPGRGLAAIKNYVGQAVLNNRIHHAFRFIGTGDKNYPPNCAVLDIHDPRLPVFTKPIKRKRNKSRCGDSGGSSGSGGGSECEKAEERGFRDVDFETFVKRQYRGPFNTIPTENTSKIEQSSGHNSIFDRNIDAIRFASVLIDNVFLNGTLLPVSWADYAL